LREFDQIEFYPVAQEEFDDINERYKSGRYQLEYGDATFEPKEHASFLSSISEETKTFIEIRNKATKNVTNQERTLLAEWRAQQATDDSEVISEGEGTEVVAPMPASVWKVLVSEGDVVKEGQVLEAMKMEIREFFIGNRAEPSNTRR
jgi:urea carboxylase